MSGANALRPLTLFWRVVGQQGFEPLTTGRGFGSLPRRSVAKRRHLGVEPCLPVLACEFGLDRFESGRPWRIGLGHQVRRRN